METFLVTPEVFEIAATSRGVQIGGDLPLLPSDSGWFDLAEENAIACRVNGVTFLAASAADSRRTRGSGSHNTSVVEQ